MFNGATEFVGATGHAAYREAILAVWDDFESHKMYLHGGGGNTSNSTDFGEMSKSVDFWGKFALAK